MKRYHDWRPRLSDYVAANAARAFQIGVFDCAMFSAGAVKAMTGTDLARGLRGYRTIKAGEKKLRDKGFDSLADYIAAHLTEIEPAFAAVGDVAVVPGEGGDAVGLVQGELIYVPAAGGLAVVPLTSALRAFRVPEA